MFVMIVSAKVVYLMSGNLDILMLRETRDLAMLLPMLLPMHSSLRAPGSSRLQQAPAYSLTWPESSIQASAGYSMALADARYA